MSTKTKTTRRTLAALAAAAVTALALTACVAGGPTASDDKSGKNVELTFLTFETPNLNAKFWDDSIARASAKVPGVTIKKLVAPTTDRDAYARQLDSTGKLPDIMVAVSPTGLAEVGKLAEFSEDELTDWISPKSNSFDGKIYQLATNTQTVPTVYYRKADFEKAGITALPKNWDEFLAACEKLKNAGINPIVVNGGGADVWANAYALIGIIGTDVYAKQPSFLADLNAGKTDFSNPLFVDAIKKFKTLVDKGYVTQSTLSDNYADGQAKFIAGTAGAMYPMGSWFTVAPKPEQQEELDVFPWPTNDGSLIVPVYTGGGLSVSSKAADVELAKKWAIAWSKDPQNAESGVKADGLISGLKDFKTPEGTTPLFDKNLEIYKEAISTGTAVTVFGTEGGTPSLPAGLMNEVYAAVGQLIGGQSDVDGFINYLNGKLKELTQ